MKLSQYSMFYTNVLISEAKYTVWLYRNTVNYKKKNVSSNAIISYFLNRLRLRIRIDFKRLPDLQFSNLWVSTGLCCLHGHGERSSLEVYI